MKVYFLSQSLQNRAGSFDDSETGCDWFNESQSLQNRAGSFDRVSSETGREASHLNPFRIGRGLSTQCGWLILCGCASLNPFGTGQGLSTCVFIRAPIFKPVSIPLEQGRVFRPFETNSSSCHSLFQSLWNRAGSFDMEWVNGDGYKHKSQSLQNRARSFD